MFCRDSGTSWQKVDAAGEGRGRGGGGEEWPGGKARWDRSMDHLTPTCLLLNQAAPLHTPLTRSPPGNEVVQLLGEGVRTVGCNHLWRVVDVSRVRVGGAEAAKSTLHALLLLCRLPGNEMSGRLGRPKRRSGPRKKEETTEQSHSV